MHGCGYCIAGCPFDIPRLNPEATASTNVRCALTAWWLGKNQLREDLPNGRDSLRYERVDEKLASERVAELKTRGYDNAGLSIRQASVVHTLCTCCTMLTSKSVSWLAGEPGNQRNREILEGIWKPLAAVGFAATFAASISTTWVSVRTVRMRKRIICTKERRGAQMKRRDTIVRYTAPDVSTTGSPPSASSWRR